MIALAFIVCALASPYHCQSVSLPFSGDGEGNPVTPHMCVMRGQIEIAHWASDHPGYEIRGGYRCGPVRSAQRR